MRRKGIPERIQEHDYVLKSTLDENKKVRLRPLIEKDWNLLNRWNTDPGLLYFTEEDEVERYNPEEVKMICRLVSKNAYIFIIEFEGEAIGECWLQKMNLERIKKEYPEKDCWRIDVMIGEKEY